LPIELDQIIDGKYRVVRVIGAGGMGTVYEGENVRIGRRVAIKVLNAEAADAPDVRRRFEREAQVAAKIGSPYICDVLDLGDLPEGQCYLVMEYLEGRSLDEILQDQEKLPPEEVATIAVQLLEGLQSMHDVDIVHRDLKPANIFIAKSGAGGKEIVKILDFGISKFQASPEAVSLTQTGALLGTPLYMSPEQARGDKELDNRSDLYAVGVCLYRALSGHLPFVGDNFRQLLFKIALDEPPALRQHAPEIDEMFDSIVSKAMHKDPASRFQSAKELQQSIIGWSKVYGRSSLGLANTVASQPPLVSSNRTPARSAMSPLATSGENRTPSGWEQALSDADVVVAESVIVQATTGPGTVRSSESIGAAKVDAVAVEPALSTSQTAKVDAPSARKTPWVPVIGGTLALGALIAVIAFRPSNNAVAQGGPSADPNALSAATAKSATAEPLTTATSSASATSATTAPAPSASSAVDRKAPATLGQKTPGTTAATATAPQAATAITSPTPAPSASNRGRKIRTDID
jgi:eukaryotic-like serine/threonine-protein kinase